MERVIPNNCLDEITASPKDDNLSSTTGVHTATPTPQGNDGETDLRQGHMGAMPGQVIVEPVSFEQFKTARCFYHQSDQHDRKVCPFFHNSRDRRRHPITYKAEQCPDFFEKGDENGSIHQKITADGVFHNIGCSRGDHCNRCHSRIEILYHPEVFKRRFCATYPLNIAQCSRSSFCAFAHHRAEIRAPLYSESEEQHGGDMFYMERYKTLWCPYGVPHDWHRCVYAHTYQDFRRTPKIGYGSEPCTAWQNSGNQKDYLQRCPWGFRCPYSHGSKEQLYHPSYYKSNPCSDYRTKMLCPREHLCAFYHCTEERRSVERDGGALPNYPSFSDVDYNHPLPEHWVLHVLQEQQPHFSQPPSFSVRDDEIFMDRGRLQNPKLPRPGNTGASAPRVENISCGMRPINFLEARRPWDGFDEGVGGDTKYNLDSEEFDDSDSQSRDFAPQGSPMSAYNDRSNWRQLYGDTNTVYED